MSDITMCRGDDCTSKRQCHRYMATRSLYQSWLTPIHEDGMCTDFVPHNGGKYLVKSAPVTTDLLDMSKPLGTRLSQEEFDELKTRIRNRHLALTWSKPGGDI